LTNNASESQPEEMGEEHPIKVRDDADDADADDDDKPVWPTWAVGALSGVRDVLTSIAYVFTHTRH
jgi:hypothetical protein